MRSRFIVALPILLVAGFAAAVFFYSSPAVRAHLSPAVRAHIEAATVGSSEHPNIVGYPVQEMGGLPD